MPAASIRHEGPGLALLAALVLALVVPLWRAPAPVDDAFISYRYADNWVAGRGLVFNPGERVEGYTNPLWVALVAAGVAAGLDARAVGHALGLASGVLCLALAHALARSWAPRAPSWVAALAPAWVLLSVGFTRWTVGGLETPLFAAALAAAFLADTRGRIGWSAFALAVATATRPEGGLAALVVLGPHLLHAGRHPRHWLPVLLWAAVPLGLTAFRWHYYGALLPNTFHAKTGDTPLVVGAWYLSGFLLDGALLLLPALAVALRRVPETRPALLFCGLLAGWVVAVGGDGLGESRFLVPLLPLLAPAALAGTLEVRGRRRRWLVAAGVAALLWTAFGTPTLDVYLHKRSLVLDHIARESAQFEQVGRERAQLLRARGESGALVATGAVGALGYYGGDLRVIDILGLVDRHIARVPAAGGAPLAGHRRSDADYVLRRRPDYILVPRRGREGRGRLGAVRDLWEHPDLERLYTWDREIQGYRRRDLPPPAAAGA